MMFMWSKALLFQTTEGHSPSSFIAVFHRLQSTIKIEQINFVENNDQTHLEGATSPGRKLTQSPNFSGL